MRRWDVLAAAALLASAVAPLGVSASTSNVTVVRAGAAPIVRAGPAILHAAPAHSPQLENVAPWRAPPILEMGTSAYRQGEYLYQGFLYGDHGARGWTDPNDRRNGADDYFSLPAGTYTYPADPRYAENAANLVELRVKPLPDATAIRFTLNTMLDPSLVAISVAAGDPRAPVRAFPFGANAVAPADVFVTVHPHAGGMVAEVSDATTGRTIGFGAVSVDTRRRQIETRLPHALWDPGHGVVGLAAGVGLWDAHDGAYLIPQAVSTATQPGGAGTLARPAAFFDVAFRFHEDWPHMGTDGMTQHFAHPAFWRDQAQGDALARGDISGFVAQVDFAKLRAGVDDESAVPQTGPMDRILVSHFEPHQGVNYASSCYQGDFNCQYQGQLQPYAMYVPRKAAPSRGYGLTLLLHANSTNYNEFFATRNQSEFAERGTGSIVVTPEARDPYGGDYAYLAAVDVFEVWADVAAHYPLDPSWQAISGYSMGGLGTYKLAEQFPDLFARAVAVVGTPGGVPDTGLPYSGETAEMASLRNVPFMLMDAGPVDELNPTASANAAEFQRLGYRYDWLEFAGDHLTLMYNDEYGPAADFLGSARLGPDPAHVTYVYARQALDMLGRQFGDDRTHGLVADHAYWVSDLRLAAGGSQGSIDAVSHGFGQGDPAALGPQLRPGAMGPGSVFPAYPYAETYQTWGAAPASAARDALELTTRGVAALTIDVARAGVDCAVDLHVDSDVPVTVTLAGCARAGGAEPAGGVHGASTGAVAGGGGGGGGGNGAPVPGTGGSCAGGACGDGGGAGSAAAVVVSAALRALLFVTGLWAVGAGVRLVRRSFRFRL